MSKLRWPLRAYILGVIAAGLAALALTSPHVGVASIDEIVLLAVLFTMATVAQIFPIHLSTKIKVTVDDTATFAGALLLDPFLAMLVAASSTVVAHQLWNKRTRWFNRGFNASASALSTGAAALVFAVVSRGAGPELGHPLPIIAAAVAKYFVQSTLVDIVVSLQLRRRLLDCWWEVHRRDLPHESALYMLGAIAAATTAGQPLAIVVFSVPMAVAVLTLRESARVREQTRAAILELADLIDLRDPYTNGHSQRVAANAEKLARRLRFSHAQVELVRDAARVHDIGKIGTNDLVLLKPGPLDDAERDEMRKHVEIGHRLLRHIPEFFEGAELVLSHHERHDGTGYPRGLKGDELPLEVSVISVADTYDAMTTDRPYRKALSWESARAELLRYRGTQWRESAVDAFVEMIEEERRTAPVRSALAATGTA